MFSLYFLLSFQVAKTRMIIAKLTVVAYARNTNHGLLHIVKVSVTSVVHAENVSNISKIKIFQFNSRETLPLSPDAKKRGKRKVQVVPHSQTTAPPFPYTKRKRKQTKPNKRKSHKRTKNTKTSFPQAR